MSGSARRIAAVVSVVGTAVALSVSSARAQSCPAPLADARRLVLVTTQTMNDMTASMRLYERASPAEPWRARDAAEPALIGRAGMGWSRFFVRYARRGEPIKVEGDKRAPAGIYSIGRSFGTANSEIPFEPSGAPSSRASTRCTTLAVRS